MHSTPWQKRLSLGLFVAVFLFTSTLFSQSTKPLPRSTPAEEGVSAAAVSQFIRAADSSTHEFHSMMILRHGKVIAEGWWKPYTPEQKHTLYSVSKSFTSTAVGFAVKEGKLTVQDKVLGFFSEYKPDSVSEYLDAMTVKDLLTMTTGQDPDPTFTVSTTDSNWVRSFLSLPVVNKPGTRFLYNTLATYMLSAIVQKVTGEKILDYLTPRLFTPLGITGMDWEEDPKGINVGGWGLRLKTEDLAKLGQLYLQKGKWDGKQLLPETWIKEATSIQIDQGPNWVGNTPKDSSDWSQGYAYQFWRCRNNAYRADGAFGQYIIVMPDQEAVVAITSETPDMQGQINLVWKYLLPALRQEKTRSKPRTAKKELITLREQLGSLELKPPTAKGTKTESARNKSESADNVFPGRTIEFDSNEKGIRSISVSREGKTLLMKMQTDSSVYNFPFAAADWAKGETTRPVHSLLAAAKTNFSSLAPYTTAGSYTMTDDNSITFYLKYTESPHTEIFVLTNNEEGVRLDWSTSFNKNSHTVVTGRFSR